MDRESIAAQIRNEYGAEGERLWMRFPEYLVFRNPDNQKWFAVLMDLERSRLMRSGEGKVDVINLKCDSILIGSLLRKKGFFPGYHMNKEHWITVLLDGSVEESELKALIRLSYEIVDRKGKKK